MRLAIKATHKDLQCLTESDHALSRRLNEFIEEKHDDYYFYGREPVDAQFLTIPMSELYDVMQSMPKEACESVNAVYQSGVMTGQLHVYLYGRNRA